VIWSGGKPVLVGADVPEEKVANRIQVNVSLLIGSMNQYKIFQKTPY